MMLIRDVLFLTPFLTFCGSFSNSEKSISNDAKSLYQQVVHIHVDQESLKQHPGLSSLGFVENSGEEIVLVLQASLRVEEGLALQGRSAPITPKASVAKSSTLSPKVKDQSSKKSEWLKQDTQKVDETKVYPEDGSKQIKVAKDAIKAKELIADDVYENKKRKIPEFAKVEPGVEVFRGMDLSRDVADQMLKEGLQAPVFFNLKNGKIKEDDIVLNTIKTHQNGTPLEGTTEQSLFVSTTYDKGVAFEFAEDNGVVFKISTPRNKAIDVNKARGEKTTFESEKEVVIIGEVQPQNIIGYYTVVKGPPKKLGDFQCNTPCLDRQTGLTIVTH